MEKSDKELKAIATLLEVLSDLDDESRSRAISYVLARLGQAVVKPGTSAPTSPDVPEEYAGSAADSGELMDIKKLKEELKPRTAIEMAVVVAYYLSEMAQPADQKKSVNIDDIEKYFKQARYPLPKRGGKDVLGNARKAGYLDPVTGEHGQYKLNPVGYNLAVHRLPANEAQKSKPSKKRAKKVSKNKAQKPQAKKKR